MQSVQRSCSILGMCVLLLGASFSSCKKEKTDPPPPKEVEVVDQEAEDTYVAFLNSDASWANSIGDWAQEIAMDSWTNGGALMGVRSYIKFDKISQIPKGSTILSAKLYLYPKGTSISALQGNSGYPGSPYNGDNDCKIERVIGGDWDATTLTWNTQPAVSSAGAASIPASNSQWDYAAEVDITDLVKAITVDPSKNYGFRISLVNESIYRSLIFASSENSNENLRPKLVVKYQEQ